LHRLVFLLLGFEFLACVDGGLEIYWRGLAIYHRLCRGRAKLTVLKLLQSLRQSLQLVSVFFHVALTKDWCLRKTARFVTDLMESAPGNVLVGG
jgi:hypothetical protein